MTRYTVKLHKNGEILDYLDTNDEALAHQTEFTLREKHGRDNEHWLCDAYIEFLVG